MIIACLSQKGGVGKSTLARLIARTYADGGWNVKIADFNTRQKTSVDWAAQRMSQGLAPEVGAEVFNDPSKAKALEEQFDLIVFDGKPDADTQTLKIAQAADLVVVPTSVTVDDLKPQVLFAMELKKHGVATNKILFVINKTTDSALSTVEARNYVIGSGFRCADNDLPTKTGYQIAQNTGRAVNETNFPTLNDRANAVAREIASCVAEITG